MSVDDEGLDPDLATTTPRPTSVPETRIYRVTLMALILLGGAAGTGVRAAVEAWLPAAPGAIPWVTLAINVTGAFVLGWLLEFLSGLGPDSGWQRAVRLGVGTGFLGGYTTYSTFAVELSLLAVGDGRPAAGLYAMTSLVLGPAAAAFGYLAGRSGHRPRPSRP